MQSPEWTDISVVPRPPLFRSLVCIQYNRYTEAEEHEKRGRPGNTYQVNDVRWTSALF